MFVYTTNIGGCLCYESDFKHYKQWKVIYNAINFQKYLMASLLPNQQQQLCIQIFLIFIQKIKLIAEEIIVQSESSYNHWMRLLSSFWDD